jgi:hypothetical protein
MQDDPVSVCSFIMIEWYRASLLFVNFLLFPTYGAATILFTIFSQMYDSYHLLMDLTLSRAISGFLHRENNDTAFRFNEFDTHRHRSTIHSCFLPKLAPMTTKPEVFEMTYLIDGLSHGKAPDENEGDRNRS